MFLSLNSFKDRHRGESCYIIGDGPSIKYFDYLKLKDYVVICCGMQAFHKDFTRLNVKYYALIEPYLFYPDWLIRSKRLQYLKEHRVITNEFRGIIKRRKDLTFFLNLSNLFAIKEPNIGFVHRTLLGNQEKFIYLLNNKIDPFGGTFHATLSLALLMGFKRVYLLGFDAFTIEQSPFRWYEKDFSTTNLPNVQTNHDFLDLYQQEIEIFNISNKGTICNVQHEDYTVHTKQPLEYKSNTELINPDKIELIKKRYENA
jgi:hypothetical protein